jgi:hypothetical protein
MRASLDGWCVEREVDIIHLAASSRMKMKVQETGIAQLLDDEHRFVLEAPDKYGRYFEHAMQCSFLLSNFVISMKPYETLAAFLSLVKKNHLLSVFSIARRHKVQAMMNLRQFLEASVDAAFAIQNPHPDHFVMCKGGGLLESTQDLRRKRYLWLGANYPGPSESIKQMKNQINESTAHSSLIFAQANFKRVGDEVFEAPYFDAEDDYFTQADLWLSGKCALTALDLFFGVNMDAKAIIFDERFGEQFSALERNDAFLRAEAMETERFKKAREASDKTTRDRE